KMTGDKFASHSNFLERCFETLATGTWICTFVLGGSAGLLVSIYLIIYTQYRWIIGLYLFWIWVIDKDTPEIGGRPFQCIKSWSWWKYKCNYYPLRYEKLPGVKLDLKKNYLMCCFPHGVLCNGFLNAFVVADTKYFKHQSHVVTLSLQFKLPFIRDLLLGMGGISSSANAINYVLSRPSGGHLCALVVGGASEALYSRPGCYILNLKNRKGFVKLALQNGAPLVPVFSFGETDLYDQLEGPRIRSFQKFVQKWTRFAPIIPIGRFGIIPYRRVVTTVGNFSKSIFFPVGFPLEIPKIINPKKEEIDEYHAKFVEKLTELFEEQKYNYLEKPEDKKLIIL
ncbi:hypothetical protein NQ314_000809, partial [Rhamnusium bicolor]